MSRRPREDTFRVVTLAAAFFGGLALLGHANGVFARLGTEVTLALALFGLAFAVLTYRLDPEVRAFVKRLARPRVRVPLKGEAA